jgi:N6-adenosine-specific RNA methylase IME4
MNNHSEYKKDNCQYCGVEVMVRLNEPFFGDPRICGTCQSNMNQAGKFSNNQSELVREKKYQIIYADPPWKLSYVKETKEGFNVYDLPYPQMTDKEIMDLPIKKIADTDAILFMWVIDSRLAILGDLFKAWGFTYKTCAFVWNKVRKDGNGVNANLGMYSRKSCEFLFVGTRGKCLAKKHTQNQYFPQSKRFHSQKPDEILNLIVNMCGDLPRIELFSRQKT